MTSDVTQSLKDRARIQRFVGDLKALIDNADDAEVVYHRCKPIVSYTGP